MERNHSIFNRVAATVLAFVMTLSMALPSMQPVFAAEVPDDEQSYSANLKDSEHGQIDFISTNERSENFSPGDTVVLMATPDEGYELESLNVLTVSDFVALHPMLPADVETEMEEER